MNDVKKRRSSVELLAHQRLEKSRSRRIYPAFQNTIFVFCGDCGSAPRVCPSRRSLRGYKHETGGFRVNGIHLFSQSGYRFALLAGFLLTFVSSP